MRECHFFSIAVDTARFRNEHLISCIGRFCFDNRALEIPLFIQTCSVSSGIDLARFVFEKLKERNVMFERFVSIAKDGAANMLGKSNGMASYFKTLVKQNLRDNHSPSPPMHSVWCFAHRLNLVTKTFLTMKPANAVLSFSDWFSNKRRQVAYKRFLIQTKRPPVKVIPQPSDTRWFFYRDVLRAILAQTESVEAFVLDDEDFADFWNSLRREWEKLDPCVQNEFSFDNPIIKATFGFTLEILDLLCRVNTVFQKRLRSVSQMWYIVQSLKRKSTSLIIQTRFWSSNELECLNGLSVDEVRDFQMILTELFDCLETRFQCPST